MDTQVLFKNTTQNRSSNHFLNGKYFIKFQKAKESDQPVNQSCESCVSEDRIQTQNPDYKIEEMDTSDSESDQGLVDTRENDDRLQGGGDGSSSCHRCLFTDKCNIINKLVIINGATNSHECTNRKSALGVNDQMFQLGANVPKGGKLQLGANDPKLINQKFQFDVSDPKSLSGTKESGDSKMSVTNSHLDSNKSESGKLPAANKPSGDNKISLANSKESHTKDKNSNTKPLLGENEAKMNESKILVAESNHDKKTNRKSLSAHNDIVSLKCQDKMDTDKSKIADAVDECNNSRIMSLDIKPSVDMNTMNASMPTESLINIKSRLNGSEENGIKRIFYGSRRKNGRVLCLKMAATGNRPKLRRYMFEVSVIIYCTILYSMRSQRMEF